MPGGRFENKCSQKYIGGSLRTDMIALTAAYVNRYAKICSPHIFTSGIQGTADRRLRSLRGGVSCGPQYDAEP